MNTEYIDLLKKRAELRKEARMLIRSLDTADKLQLCEAENSLICAKLEEVNEKINFIKNE